MSKNREFLRGRLNLETRNLDLKTPLVRYLLPVGNSSNRIQGIGLKPAVCENVNRMRETSDPQFQFM